jgi:ATP-dependent protease HslVU (ClpYQ) peptidase subunit
MFDHLETPRLADWGLSVTVCIGALCEKSETIVVVSDSKVSFGDFSADMAVFKMDVFFEKWLALFAGDDIEHIPFVLERANRLLSTTRRRNRSTVTPSQVASAIQRAYEEQLEAQIEAKVLRRYGFSVKSFANEGKKKCTASIFNGLCAKIANIKLSLKFLLAGFDAKNKGHLIVGGGEEAPKDYTSLGFIAIGSGASAALSSLLFHRERQHISTSASESECLYVACAAKYMAESATDVGRKGTSIGILTASGVRTVVEEYRVRNIWETEGAPRLPPELNSRIGPLILSATDAVTRSNEVLAEVIKRHERHEAIKRLDPQMSGDQR